MNILIFDTSLNNPNYYITEAILHALKSTNACSHADIATSGTLTHKTRLVAWDLLLAVGGNDFDHALFKNNASNFKKTALWTTEDPYQLHSNLKVIDFFDYIFTNEISSLEKYQTVNKNSYFLPLGGDHFGAIKPQMNELNMKYDIFFVGTLWPNRVDALSAIAQEFGKTHRIKFGLMKNQHLDTALKNPNGIITGWTLGPQDYLKTINLSKVTIALPRDFAGDKRSSSKGLSPPPRVYETGIGGGALIYPDSETFSTFPLTKNKDFISFQNKKELIQEIKTICNDWSLRTKLAKSLHSNILRSESYLNRVNFLLQKISSPEDVFETPRLIKNNKKYKNVAIFTHNIKDNGNWGGVEVYQEILRKIPDCNIFFLWKSNDNYYAQLPSSEIICLLDISEIKLANLIFDRKIEISLANFLAKYEVDIVHFQHLINFPASLPLYFKKLGYKVICTLHDYYSICHNFNLIDYTDKFCNTGESNTHCEVCNLASSKSRKSTSRRRNVFQEIFNAIDMVIFPSKTARDMHTKIFDINPDKQRVLPIPLISRSANYRLRFDKKGFSLSSTNSLFSTVSPDSPSVSVIILGNFTQHKGADDLIYVMNALRNEKITFRLVGRIDNKYSEILEALNLENLKRIGQYDSDVLDKHINGADLAIVWPQWPETYLMTVDELLAYNIPIISNSLGAQNERLNNHSHGILINNSRYDLIDKLRQFINNPEQLRQLKQSENNYKVHTTINEHLTYISDIYTQICPPFKSSRTLSKYYLSPSCNHDLRDLGLPFSNKYFTSDEIIIQSELILSSKISTTPLNNKLIKNEFLDLNKEELLEKIDSILEDTNSNFLSNIDLINERIFVPNTTYPCTDELVISGWATHKNSSSLSEEVIICFATKSAEFIFFSGERNLRPDVGVNFQNEKLSNSGFRFVISSNNLIFNEQLEIFVFIRTLHGYSNESNLIGSHLGSFTLNHDC